VKLIITLGNELLYFSSSFLWVGTDGNKDFLFLMDSLFLENTTNMFAFIDA
jgi:hypothetical protein